MFSQQNDEYVRQVQAEASRGVPTYMSETWVKMCLWGQDIKEKEVFTRRFCKEG